MKIVVRNEQEKDYRRVEEIARAAFFTPWRIENGKIGCPYEHWMVNELRKRDGVLELSLVAEWNENAIDLYKKVGFEVTNIDRMK